MHLSLVPLLYSSVSDFHQHKEDCVQSTNKATGPLLEILQVALEAIAANGPIEHHKSSDSQSDESIVSHDIVVVTCLNILCRHLNGFLIESEVGKSMERFLEEKNSVHKCLQLIEGTFENSKTDDAMEITGEQ